MQKTDRVESIKGIGRKKAALLKQLGIETIEDFLMYFPFRYEDRASHVPLEEKIKYFLQEELYRFRLLVRNRR